ncbi:hypothetical protein CALVIDRAFT_534603 [Calocera viscosa TUFC12733]|uniref:Uncharacterized protein n=1 Tax=Calocera viscosa (strain TUFC12733) TaxID=1330018 RepID=A0A167PSB9_CALVF|nr:hypothetical protein CALVIDRAFT_534603 [Calocera viscosa TUFC12733]
MPPVLVPSHPDRLSSTSAIPFAATNQQQKGQRVYKVPPPTDWPMPTTRQGTGSVRWGGRWMGTSLPAARGW